MTKLLCLHPEGFYLAQDPDALRASEPYQQIRQQINRRYHLLAPGVHWQKICTLCQDLGKTQGIDFLIATYYSVAAMKTQGIIGLSRGLELLTALLMNAQTDSAFPAEKRTELVSWITARIAQDLRTLTPSTDQLRDLYHCAHACCTLEQGFAQQQPHSQPDFSTIKHNIQTHIETLEHPNQSHHTAPNPTGKKPARSRISGYLFALVLLAGILHTASHMAWVQQKINPLVYQLTSHETQPKPPKINHIAQLKEDYSTAAIARAKTTIVPLYRQQITHQLKHSINHRHTRAMLTTLQTLYPQEASVKPLVHAWKKSVEQQYRLIHPQLQRFTKTRTYLANLQQAIHQHHTIQAQRLADQLTNYSNSLSPIYARLLYARELIDEHKPQQAQQELKVLQKRLNALQIVVLNLSEHTNTMPSP